MTNAVMSVISESPRGSLKLSQAPSAAEFDAIYRALDDDTARIAGPARWQPFAVLLHDASGSIVGGLWGRIVYSWLMIEMLFVPEPMRHRGFGSALIGAAEAEARRRGCVGMQVSRFDFQAPSFYERLGFTVFGVQEGLPPGHRCFFLSKTLEPAEADIPCLLERARDLAATGRDAAAKAAYIDVLRRDPTHLAGLKELASLAYASGHRSAARTAYEQALRWHPKDAAARVNLGNLLYADGELATARAQYEAALAISAGLPEAHQGLARVLARLGETDAAAQHWQKGFVESAVVVQRYRGTSTPIPVLLLVSVNDGNIPTRQILDDRVFAVTALYTEFYDSTQALPPHTLVFNSIGDADLCATGLTHAEAIVARTQEPVINPPARVRMTGRLSNARRLAKVPGVVTAEMRMMARQALQSTGDLRFPLLLRAPGFHTGRHFLRVERQEDLAPAIATLPGDELLVIEYLDARGPDGMARKYRAMIIDGVPYPLHLAISKDWKVHYFTADMAANAAYRAEEQRFLNDMPAVLGPRAMTALRAIGETLALDYAGVDFALAADGSLLVFEANATMVVNPPDANPIWDYRRAPVERVVSAVRRMLLSRRDRCLSAWHA
jgi:GNAT superfamily N-acetyltransferase